MLFAEVDQTAFWTAIIGAFFIGFSGIVMSVVNAVLSHKREVIATAHRTKVSQDLQENTKHINSMKDQLVAAEKGRSRAEGNAEGVKSEQERVESQKPNETHVVLAPDLKGGAADVKKGDKVVVGGADTVAIVKAKEPKS